MGKSIFPPYIWEILKADSEGKQIHTKRTAITYRYEARERVKQALADIRWYAEKQPRKQCEQVFSDEVVGSFVKSVLKAVNHGPIPENKSYRMVQEILSVVNGSLNDLNGFSKIFARLKLSPELRHILQNKRYRNIAGLEQMFSLFL